MTTIQQKLAITITRTEKQNSESYSLLGGAGGKPFGNSIRLAPKLEETSLPV